MGNTTELCGLTCDCEYNELEKRRDCKLAGSPNAPLTRGMNVDRMAREHIIANVGAFGPDADVPEQYKGTFTVIARVAHRDNHGVDKAHAVYVARGVGFLEAVAHATEAGTSGVWDDLLYYPPARVLTVRLSHEA
jgi:hypothetical protein